MSNWIEIPGTELSYDVTPYLRWGTHEQKEQRLKNAKFYRHSETGEIRGYTSYCEAGTMYKSKLIFGKFDTVRYEHTQEPYLKKYSRLPVAKLSVPLKTPSFKKKKTQSRTRPHTRKFVKEYFGKNEYFWKMYDLLSVCEKKIKK